MTSTVFVSSTFVDLQSHRRKLWDILARFDVNVRGMEQFGARTGTPLQTCLAELDSSDIYVGVIGFRLGSIEESSGKSYTQLEYERAHALGKEIFIYLIDEENARVPRKFIDAGERLEKLDALKRTLRERHTVDTFVDESDLAEKVKRDLSRLLSTVGSSGATDDEGHVALTRLQQFAVLPKTVSGTEVRVVLKVTGSAFSASKDVCSAFNLDFGATAAVPVVLEVPKDTGLSSTPTTLVPANLLLEYFPLANGDTLDCYVKLHFSTSSVGDTHARFRDRTFYPDSKIPSNLLATTMQDLLGKPEVLQADAAIAFEVSKVVEMKRQAKAVK